MLSLLPSAVVLGLVALAALRFAAMRWSPPGMADARGEAARALAVATGVQGVHFIEEATFGLESQLGELLGIPGMPRLFFLTFNVTWLAIWVAAVPGVRSGRATAYFASWFLAIAGTVNGIAHPALAVAARAYFPGLVSSPAIGAVSVWLLLKLRRATVPKEASG